MREQGIFLLLKGTLAIKLILYLGKFQGLSRDQANLKEVNMHPTSRPHTHTPPKVRVRGLQ